MKIGGLAMAATCLAGVYGCVHVKVDPIVMDITIRVVDQRLNDFFAFEDQPAQSPTASHPTSGPVR